MRVSSTIGRGIRLAALGAALASLPLLAADKDSPPALAPVPAQVLAARKIFISNAGTDGIAFSAVKRAGEVNQPYDRLYAAMKSWARVEVVGAPSEADIILEIRFTAQMSDCGKVDVYQPLLTLTILDSKTHFILWTIAEPVEGAFRKATWDKNFDQGISNLMADLKSLLP
ncbi:MAG: hypothetical protein ACLQPN_02495 [Bryobacteraceae bacterium]